MPMVDTIETLFSQRDELVAILFNHCLYNNKRTRKIATEFLKKNLDSASWEHFKEQKKRIKEIKKREKEGYNE